MGAVRRGRDLREFNVRLLAAVDMWGASGSMLRRRLILIEFVLGVVGGPGIGIWLLLASSGWLGVLLAIWVIGVGLNYLPLAIYAFRFSADGALETELEGVDIRAELRYYTAPSSGCSCRSASPSSPSVRQGPDREISKWAAQWPDHPPRYGEITSPERCRGVHFPVRVLIFALWTGRRPVENETLDR